MFITALARNWTRFPAATFPCLPFTKHAPVHQWTTGNGALLCVLVGNTIATVCIRSRVQATMRSLCPGLQSRHLIRLFRAVGSFSEVPCLASHDDACAPLQQTARRVSANISVIPCHRGNASLATAVGDGLDEGLADASLGSRRRPGRQTLSAAEAARRETPGMRGRQRYFDDVIDEGGGTSRRHRKRRTIMLTRAGRGHAP